ncbi:MAG TPA: hypothetical protein VNS09_15205 [Solirubrobacter sp.]|nr:hypothetical protein [Solirubrobacter sp.]
MRPAQNRKPDTYRCPFCNRYLSSMSPHVLIKPEGDDQRRRHAHTECVLAERRAGRLPFRDEVEPPRPGWLQRLLRRGDAT